MKSILILCILPAIVCSSKILGIFSVPSISHQKPFLNLAKELSLRGHEVTILTTDPMKDRSLINMTEIDISFLYDFLRQRGGFEKILSADISLWNNINLLRNIFDFNAHEVFKCKEVQFLLNSRQSFDLVLVESHDPIYLAFGHKYHAPVIAISSLGALLDMHDALGNPSHPFLAPEIFMPYTGSIDTPFFQRVDAFFYHIWYRPLYYWKFIPKIDEIIKTYFGENFPSIREIQSRVSLLLTSVNPIMDTVRPNLPNVINIEMLHIVKPKPLPKDIKDYLDSSSEGVVYFSLGSNVKSSQLNNKTLEKITKALEKVSYNVLWKFEKDDFPNKPKNVMIKKWLPQQDVLGHPNIKVFVTQGGLQSIEEAITKCVPMVGLPFMGDQPKNVGKLDKWKIGISLKPLEMTSEDLTKTIAEVSTNPSFKRNIIRVKSILEDQPLAGVQKAIWWVEYVLRHNGTEHLRYPGADLPLYKYLMLDVIFVILLVILLAIFLVFKIILTIKSILFTKKIKTQ